MVNDMATKNETTTVTPEVVQNPVVVQQEPVLKQTVIDLLNEMRGLNRSFDPKKTNLRMIRRGLGNLEAIIVELREELK